MTRQQPTADQQGRLDGFAYTGDRHRDTATGAACELNRIAARLLRAVTITDQPRNWLAVSDLAIRAGDMARKAAHHARRVE